MFNLVLKSSVVLTLLVVQGNSYSAIFPKKFVPQEFVESYRGFCTDIVANEIFLEHSNTYGVTAASTFGIGYLLALINEGIFSIPTEGFDEALRVKLSAIGYAYRDLVESLQEDPSVHSTSTLYTSNKSLETTEGVKNLKTNVFYQDFSQPQIVVPTINSRIAIQTYGKIFDKLIPKGGWYGPSVWSFTKGVYINTMYYKNQFAYPFVDIGKGYFVSDKVRMLATAGNFRIKVLPEYTTIALPFQDKRKSLVLILPNGDLNAMAPYLEEALDYTKTDGMEVKPLIVQLPAWNFTVSNEYFSQLFYMGINNTMCNWKEGHENFLQPISQTLYFYLDPEKFEMAAATGAQLNNNKEYQDTTGQKSTNADVGDKSRSRYRSDLSDEDIESEETANPAKHLDLVGDQIHAEKITFDRPFYWYVKDEVIGPVFTGLVNSYKTYKEQVVAVEEAFDDMYKYQFWSCAPKHLALMDAYNNDVETQDDDEDIGLADGLEETEIAYDDSV